jgi:hypothetical protein
LKVEVVPGATGNGVQTIRGDVTVEAATAH